MHNHRLMNSRFWQCKLLLALGMFSSSVFADMTIYGKVAVGAEQDNFQNTTIPGTGDVQDYGSYFGLRGTDPVYGETSAIWQLEQFLDMTSGQAYVSTTGAGLITSNSGFNNGRVIHEVNVLASSESYLGLLGAWGRFRLGNLSSYMRNNMGSVDLYNYGNGTNGLGIWSRTSANMVLPSSVGYDSPTWGGFSFGATFSYNTNGRIGVSGVSQTSNFNSGLDGYYSGGTYTAGVGWSGNGFSVNLGTQVWQNVGTYSNGTAGTNLPPGVTNSAQYSNAYANRLEIAYNDPDSFLIGIGIQTTDGLGWSGWANSGGSFNNYIVNPGFNVAGLNTNQYQTQEFGASIGYHFGPWTPKLGYVYGNNLMYNGDMSSVLFGSANQIPNSGYQQFAFEVDWSLTPQTLAFINFGQIWWGSTMQNVSYCGANCNGGNPVGTVSGSTQYLFNQSTAAIGLSHTF